MHLNTEYYKHTEDHKDNKEKTYSVMCDATSLLKKLPVTCGLSMWLTADIGKFLSGEQLHLKLIYSLNARIHVTAVFECNTIQATVTSSTNATSEGEWWQETIISCFVSS